MAWATSALTDVFSSIYQPRLSHNSFSMFLVTKAVSCKHYSLECPPPSCDTYHSLARYISITIAGLWLRARVHHPCCQQTGALIPFYLQQQRPRVMYSSILSHLCIMKELRILEVLDPPLILYCTIGSVHHCPRIPHLRRHVSHLLDNHPGS